MKGGGKWYHGGRQGLQEYTGLPHWNVPKLRRDREEATLFPWGHLRAATALDFIGDRRGVTDKTGQNYPLRTESILFLWPFPSWLTLVSPPVSQVTAECSGYNGDCVASKFKVTTWSYTQKVCWAPGLDNPGDTKATMGNVSMICTVVINMTSFTETGGSWGWPIACGLLTRPSGTRHTAQKHWTDRLSNCLGPTMAGPKYGATQPLLHKRLATRGSLGSHFKGNQKQRGLGADKRSPLLELSHLFLNPMKLIIPVGSILCRPASSVGGLFCAAWPSFPLL
jgi:hypothetical protein